VSGEWLVVSVGYVDVVVDIVRDAVGRGWRGWKKEQMTLEDSF
jgi:hypothetical protein